MGPGLRGHCPVADHRRRRRDRPGLPPPASTGGGPGNGRPGKGQHVNLVVTPGWYMTLAAILFGIGALGILIRRNALVMFMCIELMLNAVNLTFIAAGRALGNLDGQLAVFFVLVVAAAEVVVGLAIIVAIFRLRQTASVDDLTEMKG